MLISVVICTFNRCSNLKDVLSNFLNQKKDESFEYEIVLVDNNSTDKTRQVAQAYLPIFKNRLKYLFEPKQGKAHALNSGIKKSKGEIVAFTDDDVMVSDRWLINIKNTFEKNNCDGLGGKILPLWEACPPAWLTKKFWGQLAILDYGNKPFYLSISGPEIYGANFAFRKCVFDKIGYFDIRIGPYKNKLFRGDDSEFVSRLLQKGCKIIYCPEIVVHHKINPARTKKEYFKRWHFYSGMSNFLIKKNMSIFKIVSFIFNRSFSCLWCFLKRDQENRIYHEVKLFSSLGLLIAKLETLGKVKVRFHARSKCNNPNI